MKDIKDPAWESLSYAEKNRVLYERQKKMLEEFLEKGAISKEQHDKSLQDLTEKRFSSKAT
jgi:polyhydroxyalkanoate synthesis regulator phasin